MTCRVRTLSRSAPHADAVVVFPHAGGSPRSYISWCQKLPARADLYGVTYPGRDSLLGEPAPDTVVELATDCATELAPIIQSSGSVVLFGHSMGSYVAFETTRALQRSGIQVAALVVSGAEAPHFGCEQAWHLAGDDDLLRHVGELDGRSREVLAVPELRRMFLPIIRDDYRLAENYRAEPSAQVSCPIHIVFGESDPEVTASRAAEWARYTRADKYVRPFPGDHFYLAEHFAAMVAYLSDILDCCHKARSLTTRARSMP